MNTYQHEKTETELREAIARLEKTMAEGKGTVSTADLLSDYREQLRRIVNAQNGRRTWL